MRQAALMHLVTSTDANRKARYYSLTAAGRKQLQEERIRWEMLSSTINAMLKAT